MDWNALGNSAANQALNVGSGFISNLMGRSNMKLSNKLLMQNWQEQFNLQKDYLNWLLRNQTQLQKQGYQAAGMSAATLNGLMSGNVAAPSGGSASAPSGSAPNIQAANINEAMATQASIKQAESTSNLQNSQSLLNAIEASYKSDELEASIAEHQASAQSLQALKDKYDSDVELNKELKALVHKQLDWLDTLNQAELEKTQAATAELFEQVNLLLEKEKTEQSTRALQSQQKEESKARAEEHRANAAVAYELKEILHKENVIKGIDVEIKKTEQKLVKAGISPTDASEYSSNLRRILLNPELYGGVEKAQGLITLIMIDAADAKITAEKNKNIPTAVANAAKTIIRSLGSSIPYTFDTVVGGFNKTITDYFLHFNLYRDPGSNSQYIPQRDNPIKRK